MTKNERGKYISKITPKQQKFIDLYTSKYGELSATECAIRAGYERSSAHTRAQELLDWRKNPDITGIIDQRMTANKDVWLADKVKHLANLTRIQQEARIKGLTGDELNQKMKDMFPSREDYEQMHKAMALELFGEEEEPKKVKEE